jgi:hypothetical protein
MLWQPAIDRSGIKGGVMWICDKRRFGGGGESAALSSTLASPRRLHLALDGDLASIYGLWHRLSSSGPGIDPEGQIVQLLQCCAAVPTADLPLALKILNLRDTIGAWLLRSAMSIFTLNHKVSSGVRLLGASVQLSWTVDTCGRRESYILRALWCAENTDICNACMSEVQKTTGTYVFPFHAYMR